MINILSIEQMRKADAIAINDYNIPGELLMENAARSCAEYVISILNDYEMNDPLIDIICGSGNNGGDGFALARHLHEFFRVRVFWIGSSDKMTPETKNNFLAVEKIGIHLQKISTTDELKELNLSNDCIIDSMIGVGGSENIRGLALDILKDINNNSAIKIAVDAPTGLNTDTGIAGEFCFDADYTITMFAIKTGMLINDGMYVCGEIFTAYLGAPSHIVEKYSEISILEQEDIDEILPIRNRISSKFDYGKVLMLAGSKKYPGAAALASNAAIISGSGLVQLYSTLIHHSLLPEVIPRVVPETIEGSISKKALSVILEDSDKANVIAAGPGLSDNSETMEFVKELIEKVSKQISFVIDADAIRAIDKDDKLRKNIILTPHTGEFSRLTGISREEIEKNPAELTKEWAKKLNCIIVLKHVPVIISDGEKSYWNINGNPGMATGGSGDVLTGLIAGFLAQSIEPIEAAALAVFLHAEAGDSYVSDFSEETLTASAILEYIPEVMGR